MCGIVGLVSPSYSENSELTSVHASLLKMKHRGPDNSGVFHHHSCILGHTRLSIIDTSEKANQPMISEGGNYVLVFNGEIFNFQELQLLLKQEGIHLKSNSDTEVLLYLLISKGIDIISKLNGFFSFAFFNKKDNVLFLARDRFGEKPLKYFHQNNSLYFASDLNALAPLLPYKKLDYDALSLYFQYNYIPAPFTIYQDVKKLMPGQFAIFSNGELKITEYYKISEQPNINLKNGKKLLFEKLTLAVKNRMIADVPLGCFLSGGIDSTIISGIAKDLKKDIQTFSIGFPNEKHFDETPFALEVAKHLGTQHEVFNVEGRKLLENFDDLIQKMDEPFADSSALAVYELCKQTKSKITVALSGDGADELFGGYHKHLAHKKSIQKNLTNSLIKGSKGVLKNLKGSRDSKIGNKIRQLKKYSQAISLNEKDKYILWASQLSTAELCDLFENKDIHSNELINSYFTSLTENKNLHNVLIADIKLVLANDMLVKVDMMSMANSLEVRPPFLDVNVVELALSISDEEKISGNSKKHILKETFKDYIPAHLMNRNKKGFEVPLISWFNTELKNEIETNWLNEGKIAQQKIFNPKFIQTLKSGIFSSIPGNSASTTWAMIVFQEWISKNEIEL